MAYNTLSVQTKFSPQHRLQIQDDYRNFLKMNVIYALFVSHDLNSTLWHAIHQQYTKEISRHIQALKDLDYDEAISEEIQEKNIFKAFKDLKNVQKQMGPRRYLSVVEHTVCAVRTQALKEMISRNESRALVLLTFAVQFAEDLRLQRSHLYLYLQMTVTICQWRRGFTKELKEKISKYATQIKCLQLEDQPDYKFEMNFLMSIVSTQISQKVQKHHLLQCCCQMGELICKFPKSKRLNHRYVELFCLSLLHLSLCERKVAEFKSSAYCQYHCLKICNTLIQNPNSIISLYINSNISLADTSVPERVAYPHLSTLIQQIQSHLPIPPPKPTIQPVINLQADKLTDLYIDKKIILQPIKKILKPQKVQELKQKVVTGISQLMINRQLIQTTSELIFNQSLINYQLDQLDVLKNKIKMVENVSEEGVSDSGKNFIWSLKTNTYLIRQARSNKILRKYMLVINVYNFKKMFKCLGCPCRQYYRMEKYENEYMLLIYKFNQEIRLELYGLSKQTKHIVYQTTIQQPILNLVLVIHITTLLGLVKSDPSSLKFNLETVYFRLKHFLKTSLNKRFHKDSNLKKWHKKEKVYFKINGYDHEYTLFVSWQDDGVNKTTTVERIDNQNCYMYLDLRFRWVTDGIVTPNYPQLLTNILNNYWYSGCMTEIIRVQTLIKILNFTKKIRSNRKFTCILVNKVFLISQYRIEDGRTTSVIENLKDSKDKWIFVAENHFLPNILFQEFDLQVNVFDSTNHLASCIKEYLKQRTVKRIFQKFRLKVRSMKFQRLRSDEFWKKFEIYSYQSDTRHMMFLNLKPTSIHIYSATIFSCSRSFKFEVIFNVSKSEFTYLVQNSHRLGEMLEFEANGTFRKLYSFQPNMTCKLDCESNSSQDSRTDQSENIASVRNVTLFKPTILWSRTLPKARTIHY